MSKETLKRLYDTQDEEKKAEKAYQDALEAYIEARIAQLDALRAHNVE